MNTAPRSLRTHIGLFGRRGEQRIAKEREALEPFPSALEVFRESRVKAEIPVEVTT